MDFTNKLISKTYQYVMNDDNLLSDDNDYSSTYAGVSDGYGVRSNLSASVSTSTKYPHLCYTIDNNNTFTLPGSGLSANRIIIGNDYSLSSSSISTSSEYLYLKENKISLSKFKNNKVLILDKNEIKTSDENYEAFTKSRREYTNYYNKSLGFINNGKVEINAKEYMDSDNIQTIWLQIESTPIANPTKLGVDVYIDFLNNITKHIFDPNKTDGLMDRGIVWVGVPVSKDYPIVTVRQERNPGVSGYVSRGYKTDYDQYATTVKICGVTELRKNY